MFTYVILNGLFLIALGIVCRTSLQPHFKAAGYITIALLVLTLVFDSLIIAAHIVSYDPSKIAGIYAWKAPLEDFAYAVAAVMITKTLWEKLT